MSELTMMLDSYSKQPVNQYVMDDATISYEQGNAVCGDSCIVFLRIEGDQIVAFSHAGQPALHTQVAASLLAEQIEGTSLLEVLQRGYSFMQELGFVVSTRRQRSAVTALLATRNAIHTYLGDGLEDTYDMLLAH